MRRTEQRRDAVVAIYQGDVVGRAPEDLLACEATPFARDLVAGVQREREQIDALIETHSQGWSLDRIAPLERGILRVALYELFHRDDVPAEVAIDEAVEAAKELCGTDAPGFVNGILGAIQRERPVTS